MPIIKLFKSKDIWFPWKIQYYTYDIEMLQQSKKRHHLYPNVQQNLSVESLLSNFEAANVLATSLLNVMQ